MRRLLIGLGAVAVLIGAVVLWIERSPSLPQPGIVEAHHAELPPAPGAGVAAITGADAGHPRRSVKVQVTEVETGGPVPGAHVVMLDDASSNPSAEHIVADWIADVHGVVNAEIADGFETFTATADAHIWAQVSSPLRESTLKLEVARSIAVEGLVTDGRGVPIGGIWVEASNDRCDEEVDRYRNTVTTWNGVLTDRQGRFRLALRRGTSTIAAGSGHWRIARRTIEVPAVRQTFVLTQGGAIRGTVYDPEGRPVPAGVAVTFTDLAPPAPGDDDPHPFLSEPSLTDATGHYRLDSIEAANVEVSCQRELGAGVELTSETASLVSGQWLELDLHLEGAATIDGRVLDGHEQPVAGASVAESEFRAPSSDDKALRWLIREQAFDRRYRPPAYLPRTTTGADGTFHLPTGDRRGHGSYALHAYTDTASGDSDAVQPVRAGDRITIHLKEEATVKGRVAGPDGPVTRFRVSGVEQTRTFVLSRELVGDQLLVEAPGLKSRTVAIPAERAGSIDLGTIELAHTHDVVLEVVDADTGKPVTDVQSDVDGRAEPVSTVDNEGRLLLIGVPLPTAKIWVGSRFYQPQQIEIGPTEERVTARLSRGGTLTLTLDAPPPRGVFVVVRCDPSLPLIEARMAPFAGRTATVTGIPLAATHCRWSTPANGWHAEGTFKLPASGSLEVPVHLEPWPKPP
jgi:protocatechuate 3,4-dioxygenase beta subunit